jgi:tetratricopeptide (TPR) repeat protein
MPQMNEFEENIEHIEAYFKNQLNDAEKKQFEERCIHDEPFAREVAVYIATEEGIRQKLLQQKKQDWGRAKGSKLTILRPLKKITVHIRFYYAAAACFIIAVSIFFLFGRQTPHRLASRYIDEHLILLSHEMGRSQDSLQLGIDAYNKKEYGRALQIFKKINQSDPANKNAKKYAGLVYLVTKDYDKALQHFEELAAMKDLYKNEGLFLKAITLLQRNEKGDKAQAKQLLERVMNEKLEGRKAAESLLQKW